MDFSYSDDKTYLTGLVRYAHRGDNTYLYLRERVYGTEVDLINATLEVELLTTIYTNIANSSIAVDAIARAAAAYTERVEVLLKGHAPTIILNHDAEKLTYARTYCPRTWSEKPWSERVERAPPIIFNYDLIRIYLDSVTSLGAEDAKSLALLTIIVATFFHELVQFTRSMTEGSPSMTGGSQTTLDSNGAEGDMNRGEEDYHAEIEPFGKLSSYIREGGKSFEDLVALSFTPRDGGELYLPLSPDVVPFLSRFTQFQWGGLDLEKYGTREWSFGPAFVARSVMGTEVPRSTLPDVGFTFQSHPDDTDAVREEQASLVLGQPVRLLSDRCGFGCQ